jgi:hypothetical protein
VQTTFKRARGGVAATFDEAEAGLLRHLLGELVGLLDEGAEQTEDDPLARAVGIGTSTRPPDDPALARLFPDAYSEDEDAAAEFRRYTETGLRDRKREDARTALATLDRAGEKQLLGPETAQSWLRTLNDLRLTIGTNLDVTEEMDEEEWDSWDEDDPRRPVFAVYSWLGWLQETLVRALW